MSSIIKIAVDAMGGDNSPQKIIDGIIHHHKSNKNVFYRLFGDQNIIKNLIDGKLDNSNYDIVNTLEKVSSEDSPLGGAKKGKNVQ